MIKYSISEVEEEEGVTYGQHSLDHHLSTEGKIVGALIFITFLLPQVIFLLHKTGIF